MRLRHSVRLRITAVATLGVALMLGTLALWLTQNTADRQVADVDAQLRADTRITATIVRNLVEGEPMPVLGRTGVLVQVFWEDGKLAGGNEDSFGHPPLVQAPYPWESGEKITPVTFQHPELGRMRLWVRPLNPGSGVWIVAARPLDQLHGSIQSLQATLLVVVPLLTLGLAALVWWVVGRALRPVEAIRLTVSEITDRDPTQRVLTTGTGDEVDRLAATMNEMLGRLQGAAERERRLVADASHELRSPLAAARALIQSRPDDAAEGRTHDAMALDALSRLQDLVDQLLELARHDLPRSPPSRPVDLDELVLLHADVLRRTSALTVDTSAVSGGQVLGSEDALGRVVENLTSNASRHAQSAVRFSIRERDDQVELVVADDGPGIDPDNRQVVFQRFTRLDDARTLDHAGTGLGLAIVARIVERHGGTVQAGTGPDDAGTTMTVRLPAITNGHS